MAHDDCYIRLAEKPGRVTLMSNVNFWRRFPHNQSGTYIRMKNTISNASPERGPEETTMKRHLTLFNVVALLVSITGHIAIFITPGPVIDKSGSIVSALVLMCVGGFLVYSLALCFTEMGTVFRSAGGPYLYLTLTFGNLTGFLLAWGYIILISGPFIAFASQIAAVYIIRAAVGDTQCSEGWHELAVQILACWILLSVAFMNCFCLQILMHIQSFLTACKMIAIAIIICAAIYVLGVDSGENFHEPLEGLHSDPGRISLALLYVIFSIGGWQAVTTLTEEVKSPERILPRAIHITFAIIVSLFLLTYVSYMVVVEKSAIVKTKAIALLVCQNTWAPLVPVISSLVALACIGALSTGIMGHSRMLLAAARKGDMPSVLGTLHPTYRTPVMAIITITAYGMLMMYSGGMEKLMQFVGLYSLIMGLKVVVALLYLRYTKPMLERPYKVPLFFPLMQIVVCIGLLCLIIYQEPVWMLCGVLIYLAGIPVYLVGVGWTHKPKGYVRFVGRVTGIIQRLLKLVPSS